MKIVNTRHLRTGDPEPEFHKKDKLQLLSMRFCPYAERIHIILHAKKIPYESIFINLIDKPEWLTKYSPYSKVPAICLTNETGKPWIYESLLIADYLDEKYPKYPLYPTSVLEKIVDRLWIERFDDIINVFYKVVVTGDTKAMGGLTSVAENLDLYEKELIRRGTVYFNGEKPGMFDYMVWPWFERFDIFEHMPIEEKFEMTMDRYPRLLQWKEIMMNDDSVKYFYLPVENHAKHIKSRLAKKADHDFLVPN